MTDKVEVKALRPFEGEEGYKDARSKPFTVSRNRFAELKANGLVEETGGTKKADPSENKKAPEASNKSGARS
ncbi:hypothetical protein [Shinella sp. BYT-45]|uniref:hypothetical protein n=1 Tax=Shinella sp. BYT-45 TaxID=3377377 RepID=UPI00398090F5